MKRNQKSYVALIALITVFTINESAYAAVSNGSTCKKYGTTTVSNNAIYTCIKLNKKLIWTLSKKLSTPTPTASPSPTYGLSPMLPVPAEFSGSYLANGISYSYNPLPESAVKIEVEIGISTLKEVGLDPTKYINYLDPVVLKVTSENKFSLTNQEIYTLLESKFLNLHNNTFLVLKPISLSILF